jgi:hypothetical protein
VCQGQIGRKSMQEKVIIGAWLTIMTYLNGLPVSLLTRLFSLPTAGRKEFLQTRCSGRRGHPSLLKEALLKARVIESENSDIATSRRARAGLDPEP